MKHIVFRGVVLGIVCALLSQPAMARDNVDVVGSTAVHIFVTAVAHEFSQDGKFLPPIIDRTGTEAGFVLFCGGTGESTPDITGTSRKMTESERRTCTTNGVIDPIEIPFGYDAIILAGKSGTPALNLTKKQIFMALARLVPDSSGKLLPNTYQTWNQIDPSLPNRPIRVYGPGSGVNTVRDTFDERVMERGCEQFKQFVEKYPDKNERRLACHSIREDGTYVVDGSYHDALRKVTADDQALGIFGYGFFERYFSEIRPISIDGVVPGDDTILSGTYDIAFSLYVYVKRQHIGTVPGVVEFVSELTSDRAAGRSGYLLAQGLVPLQDSERKAVHDAVIKLSK